MPGVMVTSGTLGLATLLWFEKVTVAPAKYLAVSCLNSSLASVARIAITSGPVKTEVALGIDL